MRSVLKRLLTATTPWGGMVILVMNCVTSLQPIRAETSGTMKPNFIFIYADDLGYGDLGCYGQQRIKTPNLDRMAKEGMRFTDFYSAAPVCTPSRAALMTGCYAERVSMSKNRDLKDGKEAWHSVLYANSPDGINPNEITVAELLKSLGYSTACIGKWHLGHLAPFLPTRNGFDTYFGIPYSNDMKPSYLMRDEQVAEQDPDQTKLTERYTEESIKFIEQNKAKPFFLYLPHSMPHVPLHASERFRGKSAGGLYGDVVEGVDWSVGEILSTLKKLNIDDRTLVIFSSDNGPWLSKGEHGGFPTPLRSGKGSTYEGGMRVPCIMRWPGKIPSGRTCKQVAAMFDVMPTLVTLAGGSVPSDRIIDGRSIAPLMFGEPDAKSPHEAFFYYKMGELQAVRSGPWKLKLETAWGNDESYEKVSCPDAKVAERLFNLEKDIGEQKSVIKQHRDVADRLRALAQKAREDMGDSGTNTAGRNIRPAGRTDDSQSTASVTAESTGTLVLPPEAL